MIELYRSTSIQGLGSALEFDDDGGDGRNGKIGRTLT
jgi:hypothetical protein